MEKTGALPPWCLDAIFIFFHFNFRIKNGEKVFILFKLYLSDYKSKLLTLLLIKKLVSLVERLPYFYRCWMCALHTVGWTSWVLAFSDAAAQGISTKTMKKVLLIFIFIYFVVFVLSASKRKMAVPHAQRRK